MLSPRRVQFLAGFALVAGLFGVMSLSAAQGQAGAESKGEKVHFYTADGVKLQGTFYPGKRNSPTVLCLHALGEDSRKKAWSSLAEALNKDGNAVLTFDLRGHGQSLEIEPATFWMKPRNVASVKGAPKKDSIEFKDMQKEYYPVLVNDIAAAKAFLDHRNDLGNCNTSSLVLVGAETGATLGALWLNAEWHRFRFDPPNPMLGIPGKISPNAEGKDTIGAVWLSASSKLGSRQGIALGKLLDRAGKEYATPMVFMYSDADKTGQTIAVNAAKALKGGKSKKDDKKYALTDAVPIKGGGKLTGIGLLQKSLQTEEAIAGYIKEVADAKGKEWEERDFRKTQYVWRVPGVAAPQPAKLPNEKMLLFDTYERFLPK
jgi:hypothetical protein